MLLECKLKTTTFVRFLGKYLEIHYEKYQNVNFLVLIIIILDRAFHYHEHGSLFHRLVISQHVNYIIQVDNGL